MNTKLVKDILQAPIYQRLKDWYNIGPVQQAALEEFVAEVVEECIQQVRVHHNPKLVLGGVPNILEQHWNID